MVFSAPHIQSRGLTLVETIVVTSIFSVLMIAVMTSVVTFYRLNAYTIAQAYEINSARRGMELLVRDIREMTYGEDGSFPLVTMDDHEISFYSDIDRDDSVELVRYELSSTTLQKYVYNATGTPPTYSTTTPDEVIFVSEYVRNFEQATTTFRFFTESLAEAGATTTITDIRYIDASIIVNIDPLKDPGEFTIRSSATLRNLKVNF